MTTGGIVRVILVGATGLDDKLFGRPRVDVCRVERALHAVGELADPPRPQLVDGTVVALSPGAVRDESAEDLIAGLRLVDGAARVVWVGDPPDESLRALADAIFPPTVSASEFLAVVRPREVVDEASHAMDRRRASGGASGRLEDDRGIDPVFGPVLEPMHPSRRTSRLDLDPPVDAFDAPDLEPADGPPGGAAQTPVSIASAPGPAAPEMQATDGARTPDAMPGEARSMVPPSPGMSPASGPRMGRSSPGLDDHAGLIRVAVCGGDPVAPAMVMLRTGADLPLLELHRIGVAGMEGRGGVEVLWNGVELARLTCRDVDDAEVRRRVEPWLAWLASWIRLADLQADLRRDAFVDELTGAWNRRYFSRYLPTALARAREDHRVVSLMVFDVDDFKTFNDRYGHGAGDTILRETVRLLRACVRPTDRVCRIGGDEFAVIFDEPDGPRDPASVASDPALTDRMIAERFQRAINDQLFPELGIRAPGRLTVSGGLATYPWDAHSAEALLEAADRLAQRSKASGKNTITYGRADA